MFSYEQGPIRPPSEAGSLLVRVSRNCPWNRCAFCPVYKGRSFSPRTVDAVIADLDAMRAELGQTPRTVFLQDANPLLVRPADLERILLAVRERFPGVERVTAYARSRTLARRSLPELRRLREAGLDRLHVGLESGADAVLQLVDKGVTRAEQIEAGQKAKRAGFELSEYVMPGLGGKQWSDLHADETASAIAAITPDFVRLRTTAVAAGTPLFDLQADGRFVPCTEGELVSEIRRFLAGLDGVATRIESDHVLNLLMELRGDLPAEHERLLGICDRFLALSSREQARFVIARRLGWHGRLDDLLSPAEQAALAERLDALERRHGDLESLAAEIRAQMV